MRIFASLTPSLRQFRHAPIYALAVAGSLALAVATTCAAWAVVKRAFLDPLPYQDAGRLVDVQTVTDGRRSGVSIFVTEDLRLSPLFSGVAPYRFASVTYEAPQSAERLQALEVTPEYFTVIGVRAAQGTVLTNEVPDGVVISAAFFARALAGDASALGRQVAIDGVPRTIVGILPADFVPPFSAAADVWLPLNVRALLADTARARRTVTVIARLAPDVTLATAQAYMTVFGDGQRTRYPAIHPRDTWIATPLRDELIGQSRPALVGTTAAAALLLVIVWANIAGLAAAQAAASRRANAVRCALGATTGRLFRERLIDSVVLAAAGTAAGLWLAYAIISVAAGYQQSFLAHMRAIAFEPSAVAIGVALGLMTAVISAVVPQRALGDMTADDLLGSGRGTAGGSRLTRVRSLLVVVQVAIAIVLLVSAGLLVRTVRNLSATEMGFDSEHLATVAVMLPTSRYREDTRQWQFERDVIERIRAIPAVTDVSSSVGFPAAGAMGARLTIMGRPGSGQLPEITYFSVAPRFFSFLDVPIKQGRDIEPTDDFPAPRVVVINETMARMFWPEGNAIGARVKIGAGAPSDREIVVVGIAADVRQHGPTQDVRPTAYGSTLQYSWPRRHFSIKASTPIATIAADLRAAIQSVDPLIAIPAIRPFDAHISMQTARHRLVMFTLSVFGFMAAVLCGFGLYAVVALTAQFRRREFAIRMALGATYQQVCWLVVRQSLVLALAGAVLGVGVAAAATTTLQGILHGVAPTDERTFIAAVVVVLALAILASSLPAWRAGRIDPVDALKAE
jgi:putative ABC transport system permease protein